MIFIKKTIFIGLCTLLISSCNSNKTGDNSSNNTDTITIKGSDTEYEMVKALADEYMKLHPQITITVEGGGSNAGIDALINHQVDICNASHSMAKKEMSAAKENNITPNPIIFSVDAVAIITNYRLCIDSLSTEEISQLLSGKIKNWKELNGPNVPVTIYGRNKSSGTQDYIKEKFIKGNLKAYSVELKTNDEIVEHVKNDIGGIGYVGVGFLTDSTGKPNGKIWAMPIHIDNHRAYSPYEPEAVKNGDYVLTRPLYQYVKGIPGGAIEDFILFELTKKGQDIVNHFGFFPINDNQVQINRLKGL